MADSKRHDSLAPKGAFAATDAADSEAAAALTAALIAADAPAMDAPFGLETELDGPEITIEHDADTSGLCADELIPGAIQERDRVSTEDAMRALIELRLERTRPSDEFGAFDVGSASKSVIVSPDLFTGSAKPASQPPRAMNSLAPVELAPRAAKPASSNEAKRKLGVLPLLAAAAVVLLGVGIYRRANLPSQSTTAPHAAAQLEAPVEVAPIPTVAPLADTEQAVAENVADIAAGSVDAPMNVLDVSESEDAVLTLGAPTIINVPATELAKPRVGPVARAAKETIEKTETVAAVAPRKSSTRVVAERPETPSREAIVAGFNSVRDEVIACAAGVGGVAPIEATIVSDGRITHASVGGYYQGTPQGSCIARALRKARFSPFSRDSIKVSFPYTL